MHVILTNPAFGQPMKFRLVIAGGMPTSTAPDPASLASSSPRSTEASRRVGLDKTTSTLGDGDAALRCEGSFRPILGCNHGSPITLSFPITHRRSAAGFLNRWLLR